MKISYSILIVLFKTRLQDCSTLNSLIGINSIEYRLIVWDNSPSPITEQEHVWLKSINSNTHYINTPENISLAIIYNQATLMSKEQDLLVIFDQDSTIDNRYFSELEKASKSVPEVDLFVPFIKEKNIIYSPGNFYFFKGKYWKKLYLGKIDAKNRVAVASGMAIRINFLMRKYPMFDERLKLYGIDSDFLIEYAKSNKYFFVMNYQLVHQLSINEKESIDQKLFRFHDMAKSILLISKKRSWFHHMIAKIYVFYTSLKYQLIYRDSRF